MLLHSLEIKNYRSLENVKLDNLQQFNVLIGRNNAGKSSIFQALYDLIRVFNRESISSDVLTDRDMGRPLEITLTFKPRLQEREEFVDILIAAGFDAQRRETVLKSPFLRMVQFSFRAMPGNPYLMHLRKTGMFSEDGRWATIQTMVGYENVANPDQKYVLVSQVAKDAAQNPLEAALFDIDRTQHSTQIQVLYYSVTTLWATDSATSWLYTQLGKYFSNTFFFNPFRHSTPVQGVAQTDTLAQDGANLAQVLHTLKTSEEETFEEIDRFMHAALPDMRKLRTPLTGTTTNIVFRDAEHTYPIPLTDMGGGVEQLLMIATVILRPKTQKSTLFLEEPESHLHAGAQRFLIEQLYYEERQVFITTHSPTFINLSKPFSLYQVTNIKGRTAIKRREGASLETVLEDIGVRNSDVLLSDAVLFVEGNGDRDVFTTFSEKLQMSFAERNVNVLPMGGGRHAERGAPIRSGLLKDISGKAPVPHMFVLDRDERSKEEIHSLEARLGNQVHIFKARELENYLLIPRAILNALKVKHRDNDTVIERLTTVTEDQIEQLIHNTVNDLYKTVLIKRIRTEVGGLRDGLLPTKVISTLITHAKSPDLSIRVLEEIKSQFNQHLEGLNIDEIVATEREELDLAWSDLDKRLQLAPGEEILAAVFSKLGSEYTKSSDTARIAREMQSDEIHQEIKDIIRKARDLAPF